MILNQHVSGVNKAHMYREGPCGEKLKVRSKSPWSMSRREISQSSFVGIQIIHWDVDGLASKSCYGDRSKKPAQSSRNWSIHNWQLSQSSSWRDNWVGQLDWAPHPVVPRVRMRLPRLQFDTHRSFPVPVVHSTYLCLLCKPVVFPCGLWPC